MTNSRIQQLDPILLAQELDILDGHLLGDGSVFKTGKDRIHCVYAHACVKAEYLNWLVSSTYFLSDRKIYEYNVFDKRTLKVYNRYQIKSLSHEVFTKARQRWYPDGKKILPKDLVISRRGLLRFYMDDGSWHKNGMYLATNDFSVDDVCTLQEKITKFCGFQLGIHKTGKEGVYKLFIRKKDRKQFIDIIGFCPVSCYSYKWGE